MALYIFVKTVPKKYSLQGFSLMNNMATEHENNADGALFNYHKYTIWCKEILCQNMMTFCARGIH